MTAAFIAAPAAGPRSRRQLSAHACRARVSTVFGLSVSRRATLHRRPARTLACATPAGPTLSAESPAPVSPSGLARFREALITLFPVWAVLASMLALRFPAQFASIGPRTVRLSLALLMLSTGLSLSGAELRGAAARPLPVALALLGCFVLMPLIALLVSNTFALSAPLRAGLLLVGIVSGGQMSNLCTNIARGDVALSVAMTTASTLAAAPLLPALSKLLLGAAVPVNPLALARSTVQLVLAPVLLGAVLSGPTRPIRPVLPLAGMAFVLILILGPVASTAAVFSTAFAQLAVPVTLLHVGGGVVGYTLSKMSGAREPVARAMAFEVGFKSPALSFVLATAHFADPAIALPSAVSVIILAPLAALCAVLFRLVPVRNAKAVHVGEGSGNAVTAAVMAEARAEVAPAGVLVVESKQSVAQKEVGSSEVKAAVAPVVELKRAAVQEEEVTSEVKPTVMPVEEKRQVVVQGEEVKSEVKGEVTPIVEDEQFVAQEEEASSEMKIAETPAVKKWQFVFPEDADTSPGSEPSASTKFRIMVKGASDRIVKYSSLAAELKSLRRRGFVIENVERL